jgi:hypothetical protein
MLPLKQKNMLSLEQRDQLERVRSARNKLIAHDEQLYKSVFSLIFLSKEKIAIDAKAVNLDVPFLFLNGELSILRTLSHFVLDWVEKQYERVASEIVQSINATPLADRAAAPPFTFTVEAKDHFAPKVTRGC